MTVVQVTHYMPPHPGGIEQVAETLFGAYRAAGLGAEWIASWVPRDASRREPGKRRVACVNVLETMLGVPVPLWGYDAVREIAAAVRRADVVHVHDCLYPGSMLALRLARRHGRPTLLTQHVGFVRYRLGLLNACEHIAYATMGRNVLRGASHVVLATPAAEVHVRELLGEIPANFSVIPNGIDLDRFRPSDAVTRRDARAALALESDVPVVLFAGRLVEKKELPLVLDVATRLSQTRFLIVGDGPLAPLMQHAPPNVLWSRSVAPGEMTRYYHAADCLLLPSRGEGLPLVVQEALACGITAVVSDDEPYAATLAAAGLVVASRRDAGALVADVQAVCRLRGTGSGARARQYAEQHWDVRVMTSRYVDLMHKMAAAPGRPKGRPM